MAGVKRSPAQIDHDRAVIADEYARGKTVHDISKMMNMPPDTVKYEIRKIREIWQNAAVYNVNEMRQKQLHRYEMIYKEAEDAWQRSKSAKDITITKQKRRGLSGSQSDVPLDQTTEAGKRTEQRDGNPVFLEKMVAAVNGIVDLMALKIPTDTKVLGVNHGKITEIIYEPTPSPVNDARLVVIGGSQNGHVALPSADDDADQG